MDFESTGDSDANVQAMDFKVDGVAGADGRASLRLAPRLAVQQRARTWPACGTEDGVAALSLRLLPRLPAS